MPKKALHVSPNGGDASAGSGSESRRQDDRIEARSTPEIRNGTPVSTDAAKDGRPAKKKRRRRRGRAHVRVPLPDGCIDSGQPAPAADSGRKTSGPVSGKAAGDIALRPPVAHPGRRYNAGASGQDHASNAYAALDLGTNNCRLLVAVPTRPGQFRVVDAFSRIVRLGEGLGHSNELGKQAMDRAVEALKACRDKLEHRPVKRHRLIATEACRSAINGVSFLERVEAEAGLKLEIVDRQTEARLAVAGCSSLVERDTDSVVLFDIGGGSSEIALIDLSERKSRRLSDHITAWTSLPVGVVTLAEKFGGREVTPDVFADMKAYTAELLEGFAERDALKNRVGTAGFHLLGTSGTVTTLAGIHLDLPRYDRRRVDGLWLTDAQVTGINDRLLSWSFEERVANPCIGADRADLVLAGCAILEAIREVWPSQRLRVADRGLREGLLTEMMVADGVWRRKRRPRHRGNDAKSSNRNKG